MGNDTNIQGMPYTVYLGEVFDDWGIFGKCVYSIVIVYCCREYLAELEEGGKQTMKQSKGARDEAGEQQSAISAYEELINRRLNWFL